MFFTRGGFCNHKVTQTGPQKLAAGTSRPATSKLDQTRRMTFAFKENPILPVAARRC
ncbi:hypothetical protein [Hymenobacter defluvii]|uniref:hypothetical protein n=1 Tax=Hymenobacter defluvii TaxID=2054411 RepID=UPI001AAFBD7E|nr:hypothetical protein [Hymenobacter defluvii]